jgi:hypothetical protein
LPRLTFACLGTAVAGDGPDQQAAPSLGWKLQNAAEEKSGGHHADPGNQRIRDEHTRSAADIERGLNVQCRPRPPERCDLLRPYAVQRVVQPDHRLSSLIASSRLRVAAPARTPWSRPVQRGER